MRIPLLALTLLVLASCATQATNRAKEQASQEVTDRQIAERQIQDAIRAYNESRTEAVIAGDEARVAEIDEEIDRLRGESEVARGRLVSSQSKYDEITIRERQERSESVRSWVNLAMTAIGIALGGSALGAIPAARREA